MSKVLAVATPFGKFGWSMPIRQLTKLTLQRPDLLGTFSTYCILSLPSISVCLHIIGLWGVRVWSLARSIVLEHVDLSCADIRVSRGLVDPAQQRIKGTYNQKLHQSCVSPNAVILDFGTRIMFPTIGLYLSFILGLVRQKPQDSVTPPCFSPCIMNGPPPSCPTPLICTPTEYSTQGQPWNGECITPLPPKPTFTPCIMSDPTSICSSPYKCVPTEYTRPGQPWHGACITSPTSITTSSESQCTISVSRSQIFKSTSTMSIIAIPAVMQAPLRADSTGTKTTTASEAEFTGVAPIVVAGQVGVLALIAAFLLA
ncbi:hypothetical protein N431DRAFT_101399 [Stipitochalara longipes BDJ]|nr:hypothetical protein N431DRAFT_101399 [Stipitochalara longipes BDJ]